jgi:hypothetical protein
MAGGPTVRWTAVQPRRGSFRRFNPPASLVDVASTLVERPEHVGREGSGVRGSGARTDVGAGILGSPNSTVREEGRSMGDPPRHAVDVDPFVADLDLARQRRGWSDPQRDSRPQPHGLADASPLAVRPRRGCGRRSPSRPIPSLAAVRRRTSGSVTSASVQAWLATSRARSAMHEFWLPLIEVSCATIDSWLPLIEASSAVHGSE